VTRAETRNQESGVRPPPLPAEFVGSYPDPRQPLSPSLPEIAFLGRSNVGKSSLLNALVGRKVLARVSGAPGKTQLLNVYRLPRCYLLDLPGYGYARASKTARAGFRRLLEGVVARRASLSGVVWLLDIRHPPSEQDHGIQDLLMKSGRPVLAVLTKADKLTRGERTRAHEQRARELGLSAEELLITSATTKQGIEELRDTILASVEPAP
jgi:GTP-binding protein